MTRTGRALVVLLGGQQVGTITEERDDLTLIYGCCRQALARR